jgi:hypothetical protein
MFRQLILDALSEGPRSTHEQYAAARKRPLRDHTDTPCPHVDSPSSTDQKWKHELRRSQFQLKRERRIELKNGMWHLI